MCGDLYASNTCWKHCGNTCFETKLEICANSYGIDVLRHRLNIIDHNMSEDH